MCGVEVTVDEDANRVVRIAPDTDNPHTWRDFCANGRTAHEVVGHPRRLRSPMKRVGDRYVAVSYEDAVGEIAAHLNRLIERYGPDTVASYHGNPSAFSLGNSVFYAGLLDAIGTRNRFWVGSVDQNNAHVVAQKLYGSPLVSLQVDVDDCDCLLLIGTNPASSTMGWLWSSPGGWKRALARCGQGADLIVVDPRRTETAREATLHLPVRPGQDWALLLALVKVIFDEDWDRPATALPVVGYEAIRTLAAEAELSDLAARCDIAPDVIRDVARRFATARTAMCVTATGVGQTTTGTAGEWLGHVLNLITDRVDRPGGRRYERGLVDMARLFALMAPPGEHRTRLRGTPMVAGFHALAELSDEITTPGPGQIRALIVNAGNPVVSGPQGDALDAALGRLELLVAVDLVQRESHRHAHWLIPAAHWLERAELSPILCGIQDQPFVQYWRRAVRPPEGVRDEWEFFVDLALALERNLFGKPGLNAVVRASRWAARRTSRPGLALNPDWTARALLAAGRRVRWKDALAHPHGWVYGPREYGRLAGALRTPGKRVDLGDGELVAEVRRLLAQPPPAPPSGYPFHLNNRRRNAGMNSWLNETPSLSARQPTNRVEIHEDDAARLGIGDGDLVTVSSAVGSIDLPAETSTSVRPGSVCIDHGWGSRVFDPAGVEPPVILGANRNVLVDNRHVDPLSGTAGLNDTWVSVTRASARSAPVAPEPPR